jgi:hypothetical protein
MGGPSRLGHAPTKREREPHQASAEVAAVTRVATASGYERGDNGHLQHLLDSRTWSSDHGTRASTNAGPTALPTSDLLVANSGAALAPGPVAFASAGLERLRRAKRSSAVGRC